MSDKVHFVVTDTGADVVTPEEARRLLNEGIEVHYGVPPVSVDKSEKK